MAHHNITKAKAQQQHAMTRLRQRYGLELNKNDYCNIVSIIKKASTGREAEAEFITRQSNRVSVWKVLYAGFQLVAVYDRMRKTVCTFLPPECASRKAIVWNCCNELQDYWHDLQYS